MKLTTYDGNEITVTKDQAEKLALEAELIAINLPSGKIYVSPKAIATITQGGDPNVINQIKSNDVTVDKSNDYT